MAAALAERGEPATLPVPDGPRSRLQRRPPEGPSRRARRRLAPVDGRRPTGAGCGEEKVVSNTLLKFSDKTTAATTEQSSYVSLEN